MFASNDEKPDPRSEHLEKLARMLREIDEQLSRREAEEPSKTPQNPH